jgi:hypothetical protein
MVQQVIQPSLINALGIMAGRLKEADAKEIATDLRGRLSRPGIHFLTLQSLIDALAQIAESRAGGTAASRGEPIRDLLISASFPLREPWESPAWSILERIASTKFDRNIVPLTTWAQTAYHIDASAARPSFHW